MIKINFDKAKVIAHDKRRMARSKEFEPFDEIIMKQIPGKDLTNAEIERQKIRDKYSIMQTQIDSAKTVDELMTLIPK